MSSFALSYAANMFILMILDDFCLLPAQFYHIWPPPKPKSLYDWRFTADQLVLASSPLRPTTRGFLFSTEPLRSWSLCNILRPAIQIRNILRCISYPIKNTMRLFYKAQSVKVVLSTWKYAAWGAGTHVPINPRLFGASELLKTVTQASHCKSGHLWHMARNGRMVKLKFSHTMKMYGGAEVQLHHSWPRH
jgi:hypothetical protein